jgi:NDP-sugar pyrophosphorylase family protein
MKNKVSLTLDRELLREAKGMVDGLQIRNTSQAIEWLLRRSLKDRRTAVILAGGNHKRLETAGQYRPLLDVGGQTLIEDNIDRIRRWFTNVLVVGQNPVVSAIFQKLGDGSSHGVKISYIEETAALGTAKTLQLAQPYLSSTFLFMPCDHWFDFDIGELAKFHAQHDSAATLAVFQKTNFDWPVAVVEMDGSRITNYEEHPRRPSSHLRSMLIGCAEPGLFGLVPNGRVNWNLQERVFPKLAHEGRLLGYPVSGNWVNISSPRDLKLIKKLRREG